MVQAYIVQFAGADVEDRKVCILTSWCFSEKKENHVFFCVFFFFFPRMTGEGKKIAFGNRFKIPDHLR